MFVFKGPNQYLLLVYDQVSNKSFCFETPISSFDKDEDLTYEAAEQYCSNRSGALINAESLYEVH